ncbi:MAG TPA: protein-methionine-sulfoxide reductase catalytic subunit MsrP [Candidatus Saccharimonadales bacterium]|jgi:sulfoxide reductase catalytic subunit YedY|nr:protein-methionine-sulfoxide reductase catalytic subunit MsrP [Candidatus Saccharimonadales bacterium]
MLLKQSPEFKYSDITPRDIYMNRRKFLYGMGLAGGMAMAGKALLDVVNPSARAYASMKLSPLASSPFSTTEKISPEQIVTTYNNYYEFGTDKADPAKNAQKFVTSPWTVSVEGEVAKPRKFSMDEILKLAPLEERIYRHRCVEAWSIVVPWVGYSFSTIAKLVEPNSNAKYVAFESYFDKKQMPLWGRAGIELPYVEGLRMDEAMHPLTLLCMGMYGETLPNQDGAPVRMVIPWKYGFKSAKSLVKIKFVKDQPPTTWNITNAHEYGFYSNVNPKVDHPRWSQAKEVRLPGFFKNTPTQMFNGYGDQVASLYNGMDLKKNY